ncbi:MAG: hypothetical protein AB7K41_01280 [Bdellovibrionales bacterium]
MESRKMHCFRMILVVCLLILTGCKREDPNPELSDPIYKFLVEQGNALRPALDGEIKKLEEANKELSKMDVNTAERRQQLKEIQKTKGRIARLEQEVAYNEIRRERRRVEGRRAYKIAYSKGEAWPDPAEFEHFMTQHRLRIASRNWGERVPRLNDRIVAAWPKPDGKKSKEKPKEPTAGSE